MTTRATTVRQGKSGMVALVGATALTVVALGGAAFWGLRPSGETGVPATVHTTSSMSEGALPKGGLAEQNDEMRRATIEAVTPRGGMAELYAEQAAAARAAVATVYIVESQERAQAVLAGIENVNAFRATQGEPPLVAETAWFDSPEAEVQFWATQEAKRLRDSVGVAASSVVDLRGRSVALGTEQAATAQAAGEPESRMGGLAELYREQEQERAAANR
jgi:hypothetical protein